MNLKLKSKNLNMQRKSKRSKINTQPATPSLQTQVLSTGILFCFLLGFNAYGQCTILDLPDTTQNKIVKTVYDLRECKESRKVDSAFIDTLKADNKILVQDVVDLNNKLSKAKNRKWFFLGGGFLIGWISRSQLK